MASDASMARLRMAIIKILPKLAALILEEITPIIVAVERGLCAQCFKLAHDLTAVAAADRAHQVLEELRAVGERSRDRREALAGITRRLRHPHLELRRRADRPGQVEAGLGADAAAHQRRINGH